MLSEGFQEIHTPKLIAGASEGGAAVFKLDYVCHVFFLSESPQIYKQMAVCSDMTRVFEIGPVFRQVSPLPCPANLQGPSNEGECHDLGVHKLYWMQQSLAEGPEGLLTGLCSQWSLRLLCTLQGREVLYAQASVRIYRAGF